MANAPLLSRIDPAITRIVCGIIAVGLLGWAGTRARARGNAARADLRTARAALDEFAGLRQRYQPAVAAESISWRRTWMELQELGVVGDERLASTQQVARAAESAGMTGVKVLIGPADTTGAEKRLSTEGVERKPASYSLVVEGRGGMRSVIAFLGQLPPSVAPTQLNMARHSGSARHRITLAVYELQFTNGPPPTHSGHLLSAALLLTAAAVALTADRISAAPSGPSARSIPAVGDPAAFIAAAAQDSIGPRATAIPQAEPFGASGTESSISVASSSGSPTVSSGRTRQLTAILVADNRPVAVIDDEVVSVGDVLRDGARVARIQSERVFVVEKNGKWRTLTLTGKP